MHHQSITRWTNVSPFILRTGAAIGDTDTPTRRVNVRVTQHPGLGYTLAKIWMKNGQPKPEIITAVRQLRLGLGQGLGLACELQAIKLCHLPINWLNAIPHLGHRRDARPTGFDIWVLTSRNVGRCKPIFNNIYRNDEQVLRLDL